jgi:RNA polymerase sigma-70 factor (ECF subfamily)
MSPAAFCAFYRAHLPSVYGYLLRLCGGDAAQAEDLTQDVWFALVEELRRGHPERADIRWLISVARSKFLDYARRQRVGWSKLALLPRLHESDERPTRDDVLCRLDKLPPLYRAVLALRYVDDMSVPEVADVIGRDVGATNSLLARARTQLRRVGGGGPDGS